MNLEQLRYLIVVGKNKSLSKSSQQLHISHQGLSNAIRALEKEFGFQILHRMNKGVALTEKGKLLVQETEKYLNFVDSLKETNEKKYPAEYAVMCSFGSMYNVTPKIVSYIYKTSPHTKCNIIEKSTDDCVQEIRSESMQIAIVSMTYINGECLYGELEEELTFIPILPLKLKAYMHFRHALSGFSQISFKNLKEYQVILEHPLEHKEFSSERIIEQFFIPNQLLYENNRLIIEELLKDNLGVYLYPCNKENNIEPSFINSNEIHSATIKDDVVIMFGIIHKKDIVFDTLTDELVNYLKSTFIK